MTYEEDNVPMMLTYIFLFIPFEFVVKYDSDMFVSSKI